VRVLLTGGAGFVGRSVHDQLATAGHAIRVFDRVLDRHDDLIDHDRLAAPGAVDVVEAEGGDRSCGLTAPDGRQLFAVCLRRRIDAARIERCRLRYQFGTQLSAADRAQRVETPSLKIVPPARRRTNNAVLGAGVPTFAIHDHRRGVQEPGDAHFSCHPKHHRRSVIILLRVPVDVTDVDRQGRPWRPDG
jgi:uncharacterized protein YbjT (DUF2867 family)